MAQVMLKQATGARAKDWIALLKVRQTALLTITGIAAYILTCGPLFDPLRAVWVGAALWFTVGGCTVLNMWLDRDIDALMARTANRPLAAGRIVPTQALIFGWVLSLVGFALSLGLGLPFTTVVLTGFVIDLLVYTAWLKRRTPLSIIFGGVSGGMPVLAGRVLALGGLDLIGLLLAGSVLLWIPSHILTLALCYAEDYKRAAVPMWPNVYGPRRTRIFIAAASLLNTLVLALCTMLLGIHPAAQAVLLAMSLGLFLLSLVQLLTPRERRDWLLFKLASVYMLASSVLLTVGKLLR
ncbi:MAG: UbiA family prenyltransferase [Anaerolineae bacterium]|nr:UbiA family prenyltransferase [Anaerolineae bacterium]